MSGHHTIHDLMKDWPPERRERVKTKAKRLRQKQQLYINCTYIIQGFALIMVTATLGMMWIFERLEAPHLLVIQAVCVGINAGIFFLQSFVRSSLVARRLL